MKHTTRRITQHSNRLETTIPFGTMLFCVLSECFAWCDSSDFRLIIAQLQSAHLRLSVGWNRSNELWLFWDVKLPTVGIKMLQNTFFLFLLLNLPLNENRFLFSIIHISSTTWTTSTTNDWQTNEQRRLLHAMIYLNDSVRKCIVAVEKVLSAFHLSYSPRLISHAHVHYLVSRRIDIP